MIAPAAQLNPSRCQAKRGFTALETLFAAAILAIVSAAVSGALSAGRQQARNAQDTLHATMLARALMEEIIRLPYADPQGAVGLGPDAGETTRKLYDNNDDYHGYTDGPTGLCAVEGTVYASDLQGFTRGVSMTPTTFTPTGWGQSVSGLMITITVQKEGATLSQLQRVVLP